MISIFGCTVDLVDSIVLLLPELHELKSYLLVVYQLYNTCDIYKRKELGFYLC